MLASAAPKPGELGKRSLGESRHNFNRLVWVMPLPSSIWIFACYFHPLRRVFCRPLGVPLITPKRTPTPQTPPSPTPQTPHPQAPKTPNTPQTPQKNLTPRKQPPPTPNPVFRVPSTQKTDHHPLTTLARPRGGGAGGAAGGAPQLRGAPGPPRAPGPKRGGGPGGQNGWCVGLGSLAVRFLCVRLCFGKTVVSPDHGKIDVSSAYNMCIRFIGIL